MKHGYRKGLAKVEDLKNVKITTSCVRMKQRNFAGIAGMHAGMRGYPRIVGSGE